MVFLSIFPSSECATVKDRVEDIQDADCFSVSWAEFHYVHNSDMNCPAVS